MEMIGVYTVIYMGNADIIRYDGFLFGRSPI